MTYRSTRRLAATIGVAAGLWTTTAPGAHAQSGDGFLFKPPSVTVTAHVGYAVASADSEIFDDVTDQLTLQRSDFNSPLIGVTLSVPVSERVDVAADIFYAGSSTRSAFVDFLDDETDLPIEQVTKLSRTAFTLSVKGYLRERGRRVSRLAWIPNRWSPYAGVGGGVMAYQFNQEGDFVDFENLDIFTSRFTDDGVAPTLHGLAGVEVMVTPKVVVSAEGRYVWAQSSMGNDFVNFNDVDLSGFQASLGVGFRL